jgi:hypothetical protein
MDTPRSALDRIAERLEDVPSVPEPASITLFGSGLALPVP